MATITYRRPHFDAPETVTNIDPDKVMNLAEIMIRISDLAPNARAAGRVAQEIARYGHAFKFDGLDIQVTMTPLELVTCVAMHEMRYVDA